MPDGPGGGTCWEVPLEEIDYELEFPQPLPQAGEIPLRITSVRGHLQPTEVIAHTAQQPVNHQ